MPSRRAAAIVIGDEILSGKIRDTNGPFLVNTFRAAGIRLGRILTVSDDVREIAWAVATCRGRYAPVITSGGIGPTHDDLTVEGVARGLGKAVVIHPELEARLRAHYGESMPEEALRMARVPEGSTLLTTSESWFPVISVEEFYLLPGIPKLFELHVEAIAKRYRGAPFHLRCVYLSVGETTIASILDRIAHDHPAVSLGSYPRMGEGEYRVRLTLEAQAIEPVEKALSDLLSRLSPEWIVRVE